jgi:hypothetical protein
MKIKSWWQYLIKSILIMDYKHYIGLSLFVVLPVMLIHLVAYENGIKVLNIFATVLYLVYWMVYGFYAGYKKAKNFLIFSFIFWGLNLGLIIMEYTIKLPGLLNFFPAYTVLAPMNHFDYLIGQLHIVSSRLTRYCLLIIPPITCSLFGYLLGLMKYNLNLKRKKS